MSIYPVYALKMRIINDTARAGRNNQAYRVSPSQKCDSLMRTLWAGKLGCCRTVYSDADRACKSSNGVKRPPSYGVYELTGWVASGCCLAVAAVSRLDKMNTTGPHGNLILAGFDSDPQQKLASDMFHPRYTCICVPSKTGVLFRSESVGTVQEKNT